MKPIVLETTFAAPADRVFDALTDFEHAADRMENIVRCDVLTEGPVGVGTRVRETRRMMGKEAAQEMEVTAFEPGRSYTMGATSCGMDWSFTFTCEPKGEDQTLVRVEVRAKPVSVAAKLMSPLSGMFAGACRKATEKDLEDLRRHVEGGGTGEAAPSASVGAPA